MATAAHRHDEVVLARVRQCHLHVLGRGAPGDERRPLVDIAVPNAPGTVVAWIPRADQIAREHRFETVPDRQQRHATPPVLSWSVAG
jgi:hypothetical protein